MIREPAVTAEALISTEDTLQKPFKGGVKSRVTHTFRVAGVGTYMCQAAKPGINAGNLSDNTLRSFVCLLCLRCSVGFEK